MSSHITYPKKNAGAILDKFGGKPIEGRTPGGMDCRVDTGSATAIYKIGGEINGVFPRTTTAKRNGEKYKIGELR